MSTFDYECSKTNRGFHNHSIRYAGNGELGARLQIHGVEKGKITLKTIVAFSEVDENRPVATAPIEKFQHAEFLAKCLQAQIQ